MLSATPARLFTRQALLRASSISVMSARMMSSSRMAVAPRVAVHRRPTMASTAAMRMPRRMYAAAGLSRSDIEARVLEVVRAFDKVDAGKVVSGASFGDDLGLDSLDTVEVVMAIEDEFSIEIPDKEADEIRTIAQAVAYIQTRADAS